MIYLRATASPLSPPGSSSSTYLTSTIEQHKQRPQPAKEIDQLPTNRTLASHRHVRLQRCDESARERCAGGTHTPDVSQPGRGRVLRYGSTCSYDIQPSHGAHTADIPTASGQAATGEIIEINGVQVWYSCCGLRGMGSWAWAIWVRAVACSSGCGNRPPRFLSQPTNSYRHTSPSRTTTRTRPHASFSSSRVEPASTPSTTRSRRTSMLAKASWSRCPTYSTATRF